jgi:hypothetical protein
MLPPLYRPAVLFVDYLRLQLTIPNGQLEFFEILVILLCVAESKSRG